MTNKQKVLALIPRDKTFSEGCRFYDPKEVDWAKNIKLLCYNQKTDRAHFTEPDGSVFSCTEKVYGAFDNLGHPPTLNDLLQVLGDGARTGKYVMTPVFIEFSFGISIPLNYRTLDDIPEDHDCWKGLVDLLVKE